MDHEIHHIILGRLKTYYKTSILHKKLILKIDNVILIFFYTYVMFYEYLL